jgi:hypothetical protein
MRSLARISVSIVGVVGVLAVTVAAATIWLLLTDPVTVADAVNEQDVTPLVRELATVIYEAIQRLIQYL